MVGWYVSFLEGTVADMFLWMIPSLLFFGPKEMSSKQRSDTSTRFTLSGVQTLTTSFPAKAEWSQFMCHFNERSMGLYPLMLIRNHSKYILIILYMAWEINVYIDTSVYFRICQYINFGYWNMHNTFSIFYIKYYVTYIWSIIDQYIMRKYCSIHRPCMHELRTQ